MKKELIIASFALSGLVNAQCDKKCSYDALPDGTITHVEGCSENITEIFEPSGNNYKDIFNRVKTKHCSLRHCLIIISDKDTICWNHSKKTKRIIKRQLRKNSNWFSHYQFDRPEGSPFQQDESNTN